MVKPVLLISITTLLLTAAGMAQQPPATAPAGGAPTSTSAPSRRAVVVPQGFRIMNEGGYSLLLEKADEPWVIQALREFKPTTVPSTQPSDVLGRIETTREPLTAMIMKDLALTDKAEIEKMISDELVVDTKFWTELRPSIVYLVTTHQRLIDLKRNGWPEERFYYNRLMNEVTVNRVVDLKNPDDIVLMVEITASDPADKKAMALYDRIHQAEEGIYREVSVQTMLSLVGRLRAFVMAHAVPPDQVKEEHNWFVIGAANILSTEYLALIIGAALDPIMKETVNDHPGNPLRSGPIDLLHPADLKELRPERAGLYVDAYRQKAARAVYEWRTKAGNDALPKVLLAWRKAPLADGQALLKLIQQISNVDIAPYTKPVP